MVNYENRDKFKNSICNSSFFIFNNLNMYIIFLFFVIIHEMCHLIVGLIIGGKANKMYITPFGVSLEMYLYGKTKHLNKIIFYLSGPIINIILGFIFFYLKFDFKLVYTNFAIGFFNLLPILPLDGGKVLKEILTIVFDSQMSNDIIIIFSKFILSLLSLTYSILIIKIKNIYILILLVYLWYLFFKEERKYTILKKAREEIKKYNNILK